MKRILFCILALWGFVCSIEYKGENEQIGDSYVHFTD